MSHQKQTAFSLIELVITVAIIAIIAAVAVPGYQQYVLESHRSDAHVALTSAAAEQERLYTYNNAYSMDMDQLGGNSSPAGYYTIAVFTPEGNDVATPRQFTLTAVPSADSIQLRDENCQTMTLNHLGVKASFDSQDNASEDCW